MEAQCSDMAKIEFLKMYKKHFGNFIIQDINKGRQILINNIQGKFPDIVFSFKKRHYLNFSIDHEDFILKYPQYKGEGDCINKKLLCSLRNLSNVKYIIFAHKQDKFYFQEPSILMDFCIKNGLEGNQKKENNIKIKGGDWVREHEETYRFPLKFLIEWEWEKVKV